MPNSNQVSCPKCGHQFNVEDVLTQRIEGKYKDELNQKIAGMQADFKKKEAQLQQRASEIDRQVDDRLKSERQKLIQSAEQRAREEVGIQIKTLTEENETRRKQVQDLTKTQLENEQLKRAIQDQRQEIELEYERKMTERLREESERIRKRESESVDLKLREKDKQLEDFKAQLAEMKRKTEQGSMQLQGEVQELAIEEMLKSVFPFDVIEEVSKGKRGADAIQTIRNKSGVDCGKILYESKRTKAFSEDWITKLKFDALAAKADACVIVTQVMPDGMEKIGQSQGIWICQYHDVKGLAMVLREGLIAIYSATASQANRGEKMQMLYDYMTGNEFRMQLEAIADGFKSLQEGYNDEKLRMQKIWKEREKQLERVLLNTMHFYGSIKGIAGASAPVIKMLQNGAAKQEDKE